jgi:hypothetical protein
MISFSVQNEEVKSYGIKRIPNQDNLLCLEIYIKLSLTFKKGINEK